MLLTSQQEFLTSYRLKDGGFIFINNPIKKTLMLGTSPFQAVETFKTVQRISVEFYPC